VGSQYLTGTMNCALRKESGKALNENRQNHPSRGPKILHGRGTWSRNSKSGHGVGRNGGTCRPSWGRYKIPLKVCPGLPFSSTEKSIVKAITAGSMRTKAPGMAPVSSEVGGDPCLSQTRKKGLRSWIHPLAGSEKRSVRKRFILDTFRHFHKKVHCFRGKVDDHVNYRS